MSRLLTPIRKNDNVIVVSGKDRGKRGRVLKLTPDKNRLIVEGVNIAKRHTKPNPGKNEKGGIACIQCAAGLSGLRGAYSDRTQAAR